MRNLKKILFVAAYSISMTALSQNTSQMNPQQRTDYISNNVSGMTLDQKAKLLDIENEYQSEAKVVAPTRIDSLQRATNVKIRNILSNLQYQQYGNLKVYPR
jgi:hypothetical protein